MAERHDLGKPYNKLEHFRYEENRLTLGKNALKIQIVKQMQPGDTLYIQYWVRKHNKEILLSQMNGNRWGNHTINLFATCITLKQRDTNQTKLHQLGCCDRVRCSSSSSPN